MDTSKEDLILYLKALESKISGIKNSMEEYKKLQALLSKKPTEIKNLYNRKTTTTTTKTTIVSNKKTTKTTKGDNNTSDNKELEYLHNTKDIRAILEEEEEDDDDTTRFNSFKYKTGTKINYGDHNNLDALYNYDKTISPTPYNSRSHIQKILFQKDESIPINEKSRTQGRI